MTIIIVVMDTLESARNLLVGEGVCELLGNTRLKSSDVGPDVAHLVGNSSPPLLCCISNYPFTMNQVGFCASEVTSKQVPRRLNYSQI